MIKLKDLTKEIVAKKSATKLRVIFMKNSGGDHPFDMVINMMEFNPAWNITKSGNLSSSLVKPFNLIKDEAEKFIVEEIKFGWEDRNDEDGAFERS